MNVPAHYSPVMPYIVLPDDADGFIAFITDVFGAEEKLRVNMDDGSVMHAEYSINGGSIVRVNPFVEWCLNAYRPVSVHFPRLQARGPISIMVRNTGLKDKRSQGTGMRVLKLLAN